MVAFDIPRSAPRDDDLITVAPIKLSWPDSVKPVDPTTQFGSTWSSPLLQPSDLFDDDFDPPNFGETFATPNFGENFATPNFSSLFSCSPSSSRDSSPCGSHSDHDSEDGEDIGPTDVPEGDLSKPEERRTADDHFHDSSKVVTGTVDYLGHDWTPDSVVRCRKLLASEHKQVKDDDDFQKYVLAVRLDNALWRQWNKTRLGHAAVSAKKLDIDKDDELNILYGPYREGGRKIATPSRARFHSLSASVEKVIRTKGGPAEPAPGTLLKTQSSVDLGSCVSCKGPKPILKCRSVHDQLLRDHLRNPVFDVARSRSNSRPGERKDVKFKTIVEVADIPKEGRGRSLRKR